MRSFFGFLTGLAVLGLFTARINSGPVWMPAPPAQSKGKGPEPYLVPEEEVARHESDSLKNILYFGLIYPNCPVASRFLR